MGIDAKMLVVLNYSPSEQEIKEWSWRLAETFGAEHFMFNRLDKWDWRPSGAIYQVDEYEQDGPSLDPKAGETFLRVSLLGRYYGPGYERGDLLLYCGIAEWLEANLQDARVLYGGDSSGVLAESFDAAKRAEFKQHLFGPHARDYFAEWPASPLDAAFPRPDTSDCKLCIEGRRPTRYGWGNDYGAYVCHGCGERFVTRDHGQTWTNKEDMP